MVIRQVYLANYRLAAKDSLGSMNMATIRFKSIYFLFLSLLLCVQANAQNRDGGIEDFLNPLLKGKTELAFDRLIKSSPSLKESKSLVDGLRQDYSGLALRAGKFSSFEKINESTNGSSIRYMTYVMRGDRLPVIWNFVLYDGSNNGEWQIIELKCTSHLLEQSTPSPKT